MSSESVSRKRWTDEEVEELKRRYPVEDTGIIADDFDRTESAIIHKARRVGVQKEEYHDIKKQVREEDFPSFGDDEYANFICGFVAGEGCFVERKHHTNNSKSRYEFKLAVADWDEEEIENIKEFLGCGKIYYRDSRQEDWEDYVQFCVQSIAELFTNLVFFFEKYRLRDTHKQEQYEEWRDGMVEQYNLTEEFKLLEQELEP